MKKNSLLAVSFFSAICTVTANQQPTSNENPAYGRSHVQAQLRLNINENAEVVHFIRDTNDPKIITKTYILNYADPYSIRPYLREMVQTLRVDYNNLSVSKIRIISMYTIKTIRQKQKKSLFRPESNASNLQMGPGR